MKDSSRATIKILSLLMAVLMMFTAMPSPAFAETTEEPVNVVEVVGDLDGNEIATPPDIMGPSQENIVETEVSVEDISDNVESGSANLNSGDASETSTTASDTAPKGSEHKVATATSGTLGLSGPVLDLPPDVEVEFIAFLNAVGNIIENPSPRRTRAAPGATGKVSWKWGAEVGYTTTAGHYIGNIPVLSISTSDNSLGNPFCARFGMNPNTSAKYTARSESNQQILKLLVAHYKGNASDVGTQLAIWSVTNHASFRNHPEAQAAWNTASNINTSGFSYLLWDAGSGQPFFTLEGSQDDWSLKIIKKSTTGRMLPNAEFSVSGPGVNKSGLRTNNNGEIFVSIPSPGGKFTVTETSPPEGYLISNPTAQTVTINVSNPSGKVTFENKPKGVEPDQKPDSKPEIPPTRTEVTTESSTRTEVRSNTTFEYSDAIGQVLIAKRDNEGKSLDGAIFNVQVRFSNGQTAGDSAFEIYNGSRLFTYTHPANNHDPAVVTVTEVRAPDGYIGTTQPQTATIHPTYTRITKVMTHTITITTTTTTSTVINIDTNEIVSESSADDSAEAELNPPTVQEYTDFIEGDREVSLTFVNTPKPSSLTIFKYEKGNYSTALSDARFRIRYADTKVSGQVWELTTGSDGKIVIDPLPAAGTLVCEELQAPGGYEIGEQNTFTITVERGEHKRLDVSNDKRAQLLVYKKDAVSGQLLQGAVFRATLINQGIVKTATSGPDGKAVFTDLIPGQWRVDEQTPPPYFLPTTKVETVTIPDGSYRTLELTFENEPYSGLTIRKVSYQDGRGLQGAVFGLYKGTETHSLDFLGEFQTDVNGRIIIPKLESEQYYTVKELQPPVNHLLDEDDVRTILIKPDSLDNNITLVFRNKEKPKIEITKVDDKGKPVPNCTFKISRRDSAEYTTATTDVNGKALVEGLYVDWYQVVETRSADGHIIDATPQDVELEAGKTTQLQFVNYTRPGLIIRKIDVSTGQGLDGAVMRVWREGSEKYQEYTTTGGGYIRLDDQETGVILAQEQKAPAGYYRDDKIHRVELEPGGSHEIIIQNERLSKLTIRKIDVSTGLGVDGAVIRVWQDGVDEYQDYITSGGGYIRLIDQQSGFVLAQEQRVPTGYQLDDTIHRVELKLGQTHEIVIRNARLPKLTIKKIDEQTLAGIEGVTFRLTKDGEFRDVTTGKDGIITTQLSPGWWTYVETSVPNDWILDPMPGHVELLPGQDKEIVVKNRHKPSLKIVKLDAVTRQPMADVGFAVSVKNGALVGTYRTDENGEIQLMDIEPNTYVIKELSFPGYIALEPEKEVLVEWGKVVTAEFRNQPKNPIIIKKINGVTGEPLAGALFAVTNVDGTFIGEYRTGRNGYATVAGVQPGFYQIIEKQAAPGFILDNTPKTVELKFDSVAEVEFENRPLNGIEIYKIDSKTKLPLEGVEFTVKTKTGELIGVYKTSVYGRIEISDLQPGWYSVYESATSSPEYLLDGTVRDVELKWNEHVLLEFSNTKYSGLQVRKVDNVTKEPLQGVKFRVAKLTGDVLGDYVTGPGGYFIVEGLEPGAFYTCYETATIPGYILDTKPQTFQIKKGESHVLDFENMPLSGLQIRKTDSVTGLPLAGIGFKVTELDGRLIGNYITPESGVIFVEKLKPGFYVVQEIKGLPTHKPDTAPRNVEIKTGTLNVVEYRNKPYPVLEVTKVDADTRQPLAGVRFKLLDRHQREIGTYTTSSLGKITLTGMDEGKYFLQEVEAKAGYQLDSTVREVSLQWGKTTTVEVKNTPLATLRIKKTDAISKKPLPGIVFLLRDMKNNIIGEYTTNDSGIIELPKGIAAGKYRLQEIKTDNLHVLDKQVREITVTAGETTEIVIENEPIRGRIQITKKAAAYNDITKDKKGALLPDAVFEIFDDKNNVVDRIETDNRGVATSKMLPIGVYGIREITAPKHYILSDKVFYGEIKVHDDLIKFEVLNNPANISVTLQKIGNYEAMPGDEIRYDFKNVSNTSTVELEDFYLHDKIPSDALRLTSIQTGTWSEKLSYKVMYKTNKQDYRVLADRLHTEANNELDCRREALGLKNGEYITDIKFVFGTVQTGFKEVTPPAIFCSVNGDLPNEYRFTNRADAGGKSDGEWTIAKDAWVTIIYANKGRGKLPKTGL